MNKIIKNRFSAYLLAILCMFLWGSAFPTIKTTYKILNIGTNDYFSMIYVAGLRFFIAGLIVLILMSFFDKRNIIQLKSNFTFLLKIGLIVISFGYLFFYIGTGNTSGMKSSLLTSSSTFLVVILSHFLLNDEDFNKFKLLAIILGISGVIFSNINKEFNFSFTFLGEGFLVINSLLSSYGTIFVKKYGKNVSPFATASGQFLYGSILLIIVGYFGHEKALHFNYQAIALILYGGIISSVAFTLWYFILREYKASEISFLRLFIPFFGTALSALILGEKLNFGILIGLILVIFGIIIINKSTELNKLTTGEKWKI